MLPDLNALHVFIKVVQTSSFTAAARALGMPKSTVSQRVLELEEHLRARLLQRTTRTLSLTDQGRIYYDRCVRIIAEVEEADRAIASLQESPCGLLRLTVPASTQFLGPVLADFQRRNGGVQLDVVCTGRLVNLVEESFDVAVRAGALSDSTLIVRSLGTVEQLLVASPRYLSERGRPRSPDALAKHDCLVFNVGSQPRTWRFTRGDETREVSAAGALSVNDLDILHNTVTAGIGVTMLPAFRCADDLRAGRLERVLPDWELPATPIHLVYPSGRHLSAKVKALLDHLLEMTPAPWVPASDSNGRRRRAPSSADGSRKRPGF
jgi:DNA-binding transcriptional LysR family regulator